MGEWLARFWEVHQGAVYLSAFVVGTVGYTVLPKRNKLMVAIAWFVIFGGFVVFGTLAFAPEKPNLLTSEDLIAVLIGYSAALYAALCDWLRFGLARYLTGKRGYKWVKELDYPYLLLGAIGVLLSVPKLADAGATYRYDNLGPVLVASAIVIRLIKTRADIGNWERL
jgi:hypothetical protein